jgi:pantetheine-phosphate adenylyltransferase
MNRIALYAGSFDPLTRGHVDVIEKACRLCDQLVLAIGVNPAKKSFLSLESRIALLQEGCEPLAKAHGTRLNILSFDDLVVQLAQRVGASVLIRGLRDSTDLDDEMRMAGMNETLATGLSHAALQTVFIPASPHVRHISATLVRQIAQMNGDVSPFVPQFALKHLAAAREAR